VLDLSANTIHRRVVRSLVLVPVLRGAVKTDVPASVLSFIPRAPEQFPGVKARAELPAHYPERRARGADPRQRRRDQPEELKRERFRGVKQGTIVGKDGLERTYDQYLRGRNGIRRVQVDANGRPIPTRASRTCVRWPGSACGCRWTSASEKRRPGLRWRGR
jgi:penicillin-binding protein 2